QQELLALGVDAFDSLVAAQQHDDLEVATRAQYIVRRIEVPWTQPDDGEMVGQIMRKYSDRADVDTRRKLIADLAALPHGEGLAALCRIVRFEMSAPMSKQAAIAIMDIKAESPEDWAHWSDVADRALGATGRAEARWVRTYIAAQQNPAKQVEVWRGLIEAEYAALKENPHASSPTILNELAWQHVDWLEQLDRTDDAVAAMRRIVERHPPTDSQGLAELFDRLIAAEAWELVDEAGAKLDHLVSSDPVLLYRLAHSSLVRGDAERAEREAERARQLHPGNPLFHGMTAQQLRKLGQLDWSEAEYQKAIDAVAPGGRANVQMADLCLSFALMLHERGKNAEAAELMAKTIDEMKKQFDAQPNIRGQAGRAEVAELQSQLNYFRSLVAKEHGDLKTEAELLREALDLNPNDIDVLIAAYRLREQTDEQRARVVKMIATTVGQYKSQIERAKTKPQMSEAEQRALAASYNQAAWLIANTEGDYAEALAMSQESLKLDPDRAGYFDTLARCHFAVGDLEQAVDVQTKAVQLDPHSGLMNEQLAFFREMLAEEQKALRKVDDDD
ncbi:MAG: tetratricopeptide repeat protein, partial [Planctomycetales bacterium]|nr:tetratricopeptide repeat protein [Planctomycetales bacterium]